MWAARAAYRGARRAARRAERLPDPTREVIGVPSIPRNPGCLRGLRVGPSPGPSFAPPNPLIPAAYVAGSIASRTAMATMRMGVANRVFNSVTTPSMRLRMRDVVLGRTRSGSFARVAAVVTGTGVVVYVYTEEVPATGRRRLMLLNLGDEEQLLRASTAAQSRFCCSICD